MTDDDSRELDAVRRALDAPHQASDVERLFPLVVPESYLDDGNWPGPHAPLRAPDLSLVWVVTFPDAMVYLDHRRAALFERHSLDWRATALANLRAATGRQLWTHAKQSDGKTVFAAMMHDDGLGSSRVLLAEELCEAFPDGYRVAIPERSCGVVVPADLSSSQKQEVGELVRRLFERGTVPMTKELYDPHEMCVRD